MVFACQLCVFCENHDFPAICVDLCGSLGFLAGLRGGGRGLSRKRTSSHVTKPDCQHSDLEERCSLKCTRVPAAGSALAATDERRSKLPRARALHLRLPTQTQTPAPMQRDPRPSFFLSLSLSLYLSLSLSLYLYVCMCVSRQGEAAEEGRKNYEERRAHEKRDARGAL